MDSQSFLQPKVLEFEAEHNLPYACAVFTLDKLKLFGFEYSKLSHPSNFQAMNHLKNICNSQIWI